MKPPMAIALFVALASAYGAEETNLIPDPSFESGTGWPVANRSTAQKHGAGAYSLKSTRDGMAILSTAAIKVLPNTDYVLAGWIYKTGNNGRAYLDMNDIAAEATCEVGQGVGAGAWTEVAQVWNSGRNTSIFIRCVTDGGIDAPVYFADLSLAVLNSPPGPFALTTPAQGAADVSRTPTLRWSASSRASTYALRISTQKDLSSPKVDQGGIGDTSYKHPCALSAMTTYYWKVTAENKIAATAGAVGSFTTGSKMDIGRNPKIVTPVHPAGDTIISDFDVTEYGADKGGIADATAAIQAALDDCSRSGGGTVWMPAGTYRITKTVVIAKYCALRGDWPDPDSGPADSGTVILADLKTDIGALFRTEGACSAGGLTIYYPNQVAARPIDLGWAFEARDTQEMVSFRDLTLVNAYKGIAVTVPEKTVPMHSLFYLSNIKGTALYRGLVMYNAAGVDNIENLNFDNSYWAKAGEKFHAPAKSTLDAWTKANGTAYTFGDLEACTFYKLSASDYKCGVHIVPGKRLWFWGCGMAFLNIKNSEVAFQIDGGDRWSGLIRSTLEGSRHSVQNNTGATFLFTDCKLIGPAAGKNLTISNPGTSPTTYCENGSEHRTSRAVLYDVTGPPYDAPFSSPTANGVSAADATPAIQSALNDAGKAGGGVVYLPAGSFRLNGHLSIPENVELRGSGNGAVRVRNTRLDAFEGEGSPSPATATACVTLAGNRAGMRQFSVAYPNNPYASANTLKTFPYAIRVNGAKDAYIVNVTLINPYLGIDVANGSDRHYLKRILGTAAQGFIRVGTSSEGWVESTGDVNPTFWTINPTGKPPWMTDVFAYYVGYTKTHSDIVTVNGATNEHLLNIGGFALRNTLQVSSGTVEAWNLWNDLGGESCVKATGGFVKAMNSLNTGGIVTSGKMDSFNELRK